MRLACTGIVVAALVALAPAASAADWYVDASYANCNSSTGSSSKPFCTIGAALAAANSGDTVHVAPGTYLEQLTVKHSITIEGTQGAATTIVSGQSSYRVVTINASMNVTLSGLSIVDGSQYTCRGVYVDVGATATLEDCVLTGHVAADPAFGEGAAVQVNQATLVAERCTFAGNHSSHNGGAVGVVTGVATLLDCDLHDNSAYSFNFGYEAGGALDITYGSTVDVERTTFTKNQTLPAMSGSIAAYGGAIHGDGFTAADCTFTGNVAQGSSGGAIDGNGFTLRRCTFTANSSAIGGAIFGNAITATDCRFTANVAGGGYLSDGFGGAAVAYAGSVLTDCTFEGNSATGFFAGRGGALYLGGTAAAPCSVVRCRIAGNVSSGANFIPTTPTGGGVVVSDYVSLADCEIVGNEARGGTTAAASAAGS